MYYEKKIHDIINNFLKDSQLQLDDLIIRKRIRYGKESDGFALGGVMSFNGQTNTILYDVDRLSSYQRKMPFIEVHDLVKLIFIHELGHYFHWRNEKDEVLSLREKNKGSKNKKWKYSIELAAWEYGKEYVPENLKQEYDFINKVNLAFYDEVTNGEELLSKKRQAYYMELPVDKALSISKSGLAKVIKWPNSFARNIDKSELLQDIGTFLNSAVQSGMKEYQNDLSYVVVKDGNRTRLIVRSPYNFFEIVGCFELKGENLLLN